uniref:Reverse transcriptase/retrotransposon-derived protein RNase H-like domain-containing protein n=1 Tax=Sinocyclocheilus rhinocerous TaxID=307959 RepID=A0A673M1N3_9TELE
QASSTSESSRPKTAFVSHCGLYQFRVLPFGLCNAPEKVKAVVDFATPVNSKQVRQFLGITSYYWRFIHEYARHAEPLFTLTRADVPFGWTQDCQNAMVFLKNKLTSAPILRFPQFSLPFFIHVDACDVGLGAALMQRDEQGRDCAVAYASRALHKSERPYSTPEKECLAVIWALDYFRPYIEGLHVTVFSDHSSLKWLMS